MHSRKAAADDQPAVTAAENIHVVVCYAPGPDNGQQPDAVGFVLELNYMESQSCNILLKDDYNIEQVLPQTHHCFKGHQSVCLTTDPMFKILPFCGPCLRSGMKA